MYLDETSLKKWAVAKEALFNCLAYNWGLFRKPLKDPEYETLSEKVENFVEEVENFFSECEKTGKFNRRYR